MNVLPDDELRISNNSGHMLFSYNIDQVLVPSVFGGYNVYDDFNRHGADIAPGEEEGEMFAPDANGNGNPDPIANDDVILCVSDELGPQNEPYAQADSGGPVWAKNRPVLTPQVTALGVSAIGGLNTYKIGFGYTVGNDDWYSAPSFDGFGLFPTVTDPNAFPSPTFGGDLPSFVKLAPRPADFPYDARRVNDVDKAGESWTHGDPDDDQSIFFKQSGDLTAWTDSHGNGLLTTLTEGDLPISWTLRPSLAAEANERSVSFTFEQLVAWNKSWQDYYVGKGPKPSLPLAPGTNSPKPQAVVIVNPPESAPPVNSTTNNTTNHTTIVQQAAAPAPAASSGGVKGASRCVSTRVVRIKLAKHAKKGSIRFNHRTVKAKRRHGRLVARANFRGMSGAPGAMAVVKVRQKVHGHWRKSTRLYKLC